MKNDDTNIGLSLYRGAAVANNFVPFPSRRLFIQARVWRLPESVFIARMSIISEKNLVTFYWQCNYFIGSFYIVSEFRGSPAWLFSERGTHEIMRLSQSVFNVIASWSLYYFNFCYPQSRHSTKCNVLML